MKRLKEQLIETYNNLNILLHDEETENKVVTATKIIVDTLKQNHPFLICGNGGSASDSMHITGELVGRF